MKTKFKLVLFVAFGLTLFNSCTSDNDDSSSTDGNLLGTWEMVEFNYSGDTTTEFQGQSFSTDYVGMGSNFDNTILVITENPNEMAFSGSYDINLDFTFQGQTQSQTSSIEDAQSVSTWSRSGNTLTIEGEIVSVEGTELDEVGSQEYTIQELTDTTLILVSSITQVVSEQGVDSMQCKVVSICLK